MGYKKRQPLSVVFVRTMRLELIQANAHYPLKVACLPFHHVRNTLGLQRYAQIYYSQIYFDFFAILNSNTYFRTKQTVVKSAGNETRSRAVPFWKALPSQHILL